MDQLTGSEGVSADFLGYQTGEEARDDLFQYIEIFYNRKRRHGYLGNISPDDFERQATGSF